MGVNSTMVLVKSEFQATTNSSSFVKISTSVQNRLQMGFSYHESEGNWFLQMKKTKPAIA